MGLVVAACGANPPSPTPGAVGSASLAVTFSDNPVPFRSTGCNASNPQGWYTQARIQETAGVSFTPSTFTQKLDGTTSGVLAESFSSRFGACAGSTFTQGVIPANGAVCGTVGICTSTTYSTYQFEVAGADMNGHALTFVSPLLQLSPRPAGQALPVFGSSLESTPPPSRQ